MSLSPVAPPVASPAPSSHGSRFDRIRGALGQAFTGPADPRLSPEQNAQAQKQALLQAGLATILASGPSAARPGLAQVLAQGALAGQGAGQQTREGLYQNGQQMGHQARLQQILQGVQGGQIDLPTLHQMFAESVRSGDTESARSISEVIKAVEAAQKPSTGLMKVTGADGKTLLLDPHTGETVREIEGSQVLDSQDLGDRIVWFPKGHPEQVVREVRKGRIPGSGSDVSEQRQFSRENSLVSNYQSDVKTDIAAYNFIDSALNHTAEAARGSGAAQVALLYAFVKAMDPASAVREGEIGLAQQATPLWARAQGLVDKYVRGQSVTVPSEMVRQMAGYMRKMQGQKEQYLSQIHQGYVERGKRWGVDPSAFRAPPTKYSTSPATRDVLSPFEAP